MAMPESDRRDHEAYKEAVKKNGWQAKVHQPLDGEADQLAKAPLDLTQERARRLHSYWNVEESALEAPHSVSGYWSESGDALQLEFPDMVANTPEEIEELSRRYDAYVTLKAGMSETIVWQNKGTLDTLYDPNV